MKVKLLFVFIPFFFYINGLAQAPPWYWARQGATSSDEGATDVCADPLSSGVYVVGSFVGNLSAVYGSSLSASAGQVDAFVLKYNGAGTVVWAFRIGGTGSEIINSIAADPAGDIYVLGTFNGTTDFDPAPSTSSVLTSNARDGFLAKYSSSGAFQWVVKFGGTSNDDSWGISADVNGVYITGDFNGLATFNTTSGVPALLSSQGDEDIFGAKYNFSGALQWIVRQGATKADIGYEVIADASNVYFIGTYDKDINLFNATGGTAASSLVSQQNNKNSVVISAYTQAGVFLWANNISSTDDNRGLGITQDNNTIYITGSISDVASFQYPSPSFTLTANNDDFFVASLSKSTGAFQWVSSETGSGNGDETGYDLEYVSGKLVVSGMFTASLDYQPFGGSLVTATNIDPFLTCFDVNGNFLWNAPYGGSNNELPVGLDVNTTGGIFVCGSYGNSNMSFGSITLSTGNNTNIFVAKLGCDSILVNAVTPPWQTICAAGLPSVIAGTVSAGYNYSIQWQKSTDNVNWISAGVTATNTNYTPSTPSVSTWYRRVVSAMTGCTNYSNSASSEIALAQLPTANAGTNQVICISSPVATLAAVTPTFGTGVWSVVSGSATIVSPTLAGTAVTGLGLGTSVFQWAVSDGVCAAVTATMAISAANLPSAANAGSGQTLCAQSTTLLALLPSNGSGFWSTGVGAGSIANSNAASTSVSGLSAGVNSFIWTMSNTICPASSDTVWIQSDAIPVSPSAGRDQTICVADYKLSGSAPSVGIGVWSIITGSAIINGPAYNNAPIDSLAIGDTRFRWTVTNGVCPSVYDEVVITREVAPDPAEAGPDQKVEQPFVQLSATSPTIGSGAWQVLSGNGSPDDVTNPSAIVTGLSVGDNTFRWTVRKGTCAASISDVTVFMEELKIPGGFSPNGDGINDTYVVPGIDYYENVDFTVFNRWGGLVFHDSSYKNNWDGLNMSHELLADDTYYFTLNIRKGMNYSGYVVLKTNR